VKPKRTKQATSKKAKACKAPAKQDVDWSWLESSKDCTNEPGAWKGIILAGHSETKPCPRFSKAEQRQFDQMMARWQEEMAFIAAQWPDAEPPKH
jgi:hypothetical protein